METVTTSKLHVGEGRQRFVGRACLVTGGGRGIGRAIALALAAEGGLVGVLSRTEAQCDEVAGQMEGRGMSLVADVSDEAACRRAVDEFVERFGPPSLLVNAAGVSPVRGRSEHHDPALLRQIVDINFLGAFAVTRAAASGLFQTRGAVVNIASVLGCAASPRLAGYGAAKAALIHLTRTLAREWADRGVRVNAVCPGYVETELTSAMLSVPRLRDEILASTPLGRLGLLEEVVAPVLFLASEEASYITGAALLVDGGTAA